MCIRDSSVSVRVETAAGCTASQTLDMFLNDITSSGNIGQVSTTICAGETPPAFTNVASATGVGTISYQWQSRTFGTDFINVPVSATTQVYTETSALGTTTFYRRAAISTLGGKQCEEYSNVIEIKVGTPPISTLQVQGTAISAPATLTLCAGENVTFNAAGGGAAELLFYLDNNPLGVKSGSSTLSTSTLITGNRIKVETFDAIGCSSFSDEIVVQIVDNPVISITSTAFASSASSSSFCDGEAITFTATSTSKTDPKGPASAQGSIANIESGIYYIRGMFVENNSETLVLSKYSTTPSLRVGFTVEEKIVTPEDDTSLLDNATGSSNFAAKGAHRLKIELTLTSLAESSTADSSFIEVVRVKGGIVQYEALAVSINTDKLSIYTGDTSQSDQVPLVSSTRTNTWNGTITHEFTATFTSADARRHFFNQGGFIRILASTSDGSSLGSSWQNMFNTNAGNVDLKAHSTTRSGSGGSVSGALGNYELSGAYQYIYQNFDAGGGAYSANDYYIEAYAASDSLIKIRQTWRDEKGGNPDENVGDLTATIQAATAITDVFGTAPGVSSGSGTTL